MLTLLVTVGVVVDPTTKASLAAIMQWNMRNRKIILTLMEPIYMKEEDTSSFITLFYSPLTFSFLFQ